MGNPPLDGHCGYTISLRMVNILKRGSRQISSSGNPEDQRQHGADDQADDDGEIEAAMLAANDDVARQPAQSQPGKPGPKKTGADQRKAQYDQKAVHGRRLECPAAEWQPARIDRAGTGGYPCRLGFWRGQDE